MSDVFDNDMIYIQKGGILGMKALRGLVGAWNKYLDSLKLPVKNVTQAQVEEHIPKKFNWRRVITKSAAGVDEVAVQFQSKEDPRFSWTTPTIKVKTKRQRALQLAMPSRQQERRPTAQEYLRHIRMTAPTFLRESPRDIARPETQSVFSAVYGEEELTQQPQAEETEQTGITHLDIEPTMPPPSISTRPPDVEHEIEVAEQTYLGLSPPRIFQRPTYTKEQYAKSGAGVWVVGDIAKMKSKAPAFLDQTYYHILGKEEFGGKLFHTKEDAIQHREDIVNNINNGHFVYKTAKKIRNMTDKQRRYWTRGVIDYMASGKYDKQTKKWGPAVHKVEYRSECYNKKPWEDIGVLNRPPFMVIGGVVGMLLKHHPDFAMGEDESILESKTDYIRTGDRWVSERWKPDNPRPDKIYTPAMMRKWDLARWIAEFLLMERVSVGGLGDLDDTGVRGKEYLDYYYDNLGDGMNEENMWIVSGQDNEGSFYNPPLEFKTRVETDRNDDERMRRGRNFMDKMYRILGMNFINKTGEGKNENRVYVLTKMNERGTLIPFDYWNWWSYGRPNGEDAGEGSVYPVGDTGMWGIRGIQPIYLFRTEHDAYWFRGNFTGPIVKADQPVAKKGIHTIYPVKPPTERELANIQRIKDRICFSRIKKISNPVSQEERHRQKWFEETAIRQKRPDPLDIEIPRMDQSNDYELTEFICGYDFEEDAEEDEGVGIRKLLAGFDVKQFTDSKTHTGITDKGTLRHNWSLRPVFTKKNKKGFFKTRQRPSGKRQLRGKYRFHLDDEPIDQYFSLKGYSLLKGVYEIRDEPE